MPDLQSSLAQLAIAVDACQGRVDEPALAQARSVLTRVDRRLSMGQAITVVAIAGPTGSGKSSLFNALTNTALAEPGVRRPMTQQAMAAIFGPVDASGLLDWVGVTRRHGLAGADLDGVVLLDLADYDSVVGTHRDEVDRLLDVVDELLWVVDPQKYADAILHQRYLRRLAGHGEVMTFILNQTDRLTQYQLADIKEDLVRLLRLDGLTHPQVYAVSALSGDGIEALRQHLVQIGVRKRSMVARLQADVFAQARALRGLLGDAPGQTLVSGDVATLTKAGMEAISSDQIGEAVKVAVRRRGRAATGWPLLSWISRVKTDPLKRLHLDQFRSRRGDTEVPELVRSALTLHPVSRARIDTAIRGVTTPVLASLPSQWRQVMGRVIAGAARALPDAIDQGVVSTDLGVTASHLWWRVLRLIQWLVLVVAVVGLMWLGVNAVMTSFLGLPSLPTPLVGRLPLPTVMLLGGVVIGLVMAGFARLGVNVTAATCARMAVRRLRRSMEAVMAQTMVRPVNDEVKRLDQAREALNRVLAG